MVSLALARRGNERDVSWFAVLPGGVTSSSPVAIAADSA